MPSYSDIIKNNREVSAVKWWPNFAYHFTDVMNAAGILSSGVLYSRTEAVRNNRMVNNNASTQVINITDNAVRSSVRFYFRPLTPTQYYNEGYKHKELRFDSADKDGSIGANVPIPVFLTFRLNELLNEDRIMFSEFSQAGHGAQLYKGPEDFSRLDFEKIYSNGPADDETRKYRHAELIIPERYFIDRSLYRILCRNDFECDTLRNLLLEQNPSAYNKCKDKIVVYNEKNEIFYNNGLYVAGIDVCGNSLRIRFVDNYNRIKYTDNMIQKRQITAPLEKLCMKIELSWKDANGNYILSQTYFANVDYINPENILVSGIDYIQKARTIMVRLSIDEALVGYAEICLSGDELV